MRLHPGTAGTTVLGLVYVIGIVVSVVYNLSGQIARDIEDSRWRTRAGISWSKADGTYVPYISMWRNVVESVPCFSIRPVFEMGGGFVSRRRIKRGGNRRTLALASVVRRSHTLLRCVPYHDSSTDMWAP
jgi:hypothetical protein